jgi:uncharacterized protein
MDRVAPSSRPDAPVIGYQRWDKILFLHWAVAPEAVRPLVPGRLELDTYEGRAYVSMTPFTVRGARLRALPAVPGFSQFHELNVRTYVHREGRDPAVWFFSLDAASPLAAAFARLSVRLPYCYARISRGTDGNRMTYESTRLFPPQAASFSASWSFGRASAAAEPGTLGHFLVERYLLFSRALASKLIRLQVHHPPWQLHEVESLVVQETLAKGDGLGALEGTPLAHYSDGIDVEFFPFTIV